jgi:PIN domain nuclease of toxin-antitoxin system
MQILPVSLEQVFALGTLPAHHKDPFDRLLIAQATVEDLFPVSGDPVFSSYPVKLLW